VEPVRLLVLEELRSLGAGTPQPGAAPGQ
jgi:hypothetical protein